MQALQSVHGPAALLMRVPIITAAAMVAAAVPAAAVEPLRTPQPDRLYLGRIAYERWQPIMLKTSPDGRRVKVAPGYFNSLSRCGARGGEISDSEIRSKRWVRVGPNRAFAGRGSGWTWLDTTQFWRGVYSWRITGRFTSPTTATGRITITGAMHDNGRPWLRCPTRTVRWETRRTERATGNLRDF